MSLRGIKKAIVRTPHKLLGKKSVEDTDIVDWEADLKAAETGLGFIASETKKLASIWAKSLECQSAIIETFLRVNAGAVPQQQRGKSHTEATHHTQRIKDVEFEELDVEVDVSPLFLEQLAEYRTLTVQLKLNVGYRNHEVETSVKAQCIQMKGYLHDLGKLLAKRKRKKIDMDRSVSGIYKLKHKSEALSELEITKLVDLERNHAAAETAFREIDEKMHLVLPEALSLLSEFLNKMSSKLYGHNLWVFRQINEAFMRFGVYYGLVKNDQFETYNYQDIIRLWESAIVKTYQIDALTLLTHGETPLAVEEVEIDSENETQEEEHGNAVIRKLEHAAGTVKQKVNPLHTTHAPKLKGGIFELAADPLESFVKFNDPEFQQADLVAHTVSVSSPTSPQRGWSPFIKNAPFLPFRSRSGSLNDNSHLRVSTDLHLKPQDTHSYTPVSGSPLKSDYDPEQALTAVPISPTSVLSSDTVKSAAMKAVEDGLSWMYNAHKFEVTESPLAVPFQRSRLNTYPLMVNPALASSLEESRRIIGASSLTFKLEHGGKKTEGVDDDVDSSHSFKSAEDFEFAAVVSPIK
ncbi:hypothetical protein BABINDRAFT_164222 [Babjeviella inositovora NRRL Y-12698]|uniref:BAR domain-containing protein n=1 Tax=Babjeviella inositovora NRRL Y-12698 TaxID=984486 RepID=A0A1E3QXN8_9ASCO|nr:uncharacterized protein BABINDRAFT_164222 [Babjeviella inositovora NRRL Y-12698]ODQ82428.1 hypothetical protein BABINDRAFT_164222 [Babjeviella inositovora NRRL Y-12698]